MLPTVVDVRRQQLPIRLGVCAIIAVLFHPIAGVLPSILWVSSYACLQVLERFIFRKRGQKTGLTPRTSTVLLAMMVISNIVFSLFGIALAHGGVWGLACTVLLWSGTIVNGAMVSGESKAALIASVSAPVLAFFTIPYFVITSGGPLKVGLIIAAGGILNATTVMLLWVATRRLLLTTARAKETARLALLDSETGLPNRCEIENRIAAMSGRSDGVPFVAAIGLDRFDSLSNAIGNALTIDLVRGVASRLDTACPGAKIARLSTSMLGTAWVAENADQARQKMLALHHAMKVPIVLRGTPIDVNVTIGLSQESDGSGSSDIAIIDRAVIAIDQARRAHQPTAHFAADLLGDPAAALSLMGEMLDALDRDMMDVHYQPKQDLRTRKIIGVEALVRWPHPQRGPLAPDLFLPMAEETGRVAALTEWVLKRAIRDQKQLAEQGHPLSFAINLSGCLLDDENFAKTLLAIAGHAHGKIIFEVTETSVISNPEVACRTLETFRAAGIGISIDDYGTGMSSLGYLKNIPADELKIDKMFVLKVAHNEIDAIIVRSAVHLAHSLGLTVVAEGVESKNALDLLAAINCDLAQGYFIARPVPLPDIAAMLGAPEAVVSEPQAPEVASMEAA